MENGGLTLLDCILAISGFGLASVCEAMMRRRRDTTCDNRFNSIYAVLCVYLITHLLERDVHVPFCVGLCVCVCVIRNRVEWESRWTGLQKSAADDLVGAHLPT